jgi:transcription elongation GreA/GreB family factor
MSSAFTREQDEPRDETPDRPISPNRNLVTPEGLAQIEAALARLHVERDEAEAKGDVTALANAQRDLRYWLARRASAELVHPIMDVTHVRFGHRVVVEMENAERREYRLVGEDEADPAKGLIPYAAPLAKDLLGKSVGDKVEVVHHGATIVSIS